jgi:hypothetical protein
LKKGEVKRFLKDPVYQIVHEHIGAELLFDVWLLDFHCNIASVLEFGLVDLS